MREPRLGDDIDDFCVRCKRVMNHNIVSVIKGEPAKVRCRTCHSDHDFRHEQAPPPKVDLRKQALFNEVLKKVSPGDTGAGEFFRNLGRTREIVTILLNHGFGDVVERLRLMRYLRWWRRRSAWPGRKRTRAGAAPPLRGQNRTSPGSSFTAASAGG